MMTDFRMKSFQLGLTGYPLGHSLSPVIHAAALQACGLKGNYSLYPIHPQDSEGLSGLISSMRNGSLDGLNVTIPHKQKIVSLLDELTPEAKFIGAVSVIYRQGEKLTGANMDAPGFLTDLKRFLGNWDREAGKAALVLGAGGSARAVVYALLMDGWSVTVASRRIEQTQELSNLFDGDKVQVMDFAHFNPNGFQLFVNTTPLGMWPDVEQSPWPEGIAFPPGAVVYDLVYNPRETQLVRNAQAHGLLATSGIGMLIEQAALAFETWTGNHPPRDILWDAINPKLTTDH